jgi:hypothetical protein
MHAKGQVCIFWGRVGVFYFFCFQNVPMKFSLCSHHVPIVFPTSLPQLFNMNHKYITIRVLFVIIIENISIGHSPNLVYMFNELKQIET